MRTISRDELRSKLNEYPGRTLLIDVRDRGDYETEHIRGAISIPISELEMRAAKSFSPDQEVIVYCGGFDCPASTRAAKILDRQGFRGVIEYKGGPADWKHAGFPTQ